MIVVGLGFGDEGKGLTTSFLCSKVKKPLVVRFNGGHQAGHTVVHNGKRHVFSSFGSGTLQGAPTYWSQFCTFYPHAFLNEYKLLDNPVIYISPMCPVTTPFEVIYNQKEAKRSLHGSVGVGFGATIRRQEDHYKIFVRDLFYDTVLRQKLIQVGMDYYGIFGATCNQIIDKFMEEVKEVRTKIQLSNGMPYGFDYVFEGAQGILLDMDFGFFPNVTRSNTTTKNVNSLDLQYNEIYYVTRSYLTRHGNGSLPGECELPLVNNENETNKPHDFQGQFRTAPLSFELLNYALDCDQNFLGMRQKNLVITCMDQLEIDVDLLLSNLHHSFLNVYISRGPSLKDISIYKR